MGQDIEERLADLEQRLGQLEDRKAIYDRLMGYARGIDRNDGDLVEDTFWPDALVDHGHSAFRGEGIGLAFGNMSQRTTAFQIHYIANIVMEIHGDEAITEAQAWYVAETERNNEPYLVQRAVRYIDRWEKRAGVWRVFHRTVPENWNQIEAITERYPNQEGIVYSRGDRTDISYYLFDLTRNRERPPLTLPDNDSNQEHASGRTESAGFVAPSRAKDLGYVFDYSVDGPAA